MVEASPTNIREVIAGQRSVPHAMAAWMRGLCAMIYTAADSGNIAPLVALADDIAANPAAWGAAVTQNTALAADISALDMDMGRVPTGMSSAFTTPGTRRAVTETTAAAEDKSEQEKAAAEKAEREKATADRAAEQRAGAQTQRQQAQQDKREGA